MGVPELAVSTLFHILFMMDEEERDQSFYPVSCLTSSIGSRAQIRGTGSGDTRAGCADCAYFRSTSRRQTLSLTVSCGFSRRTNVSRFAPSPVSRHKVNPTAHTWELSYRLYRLRVSRPRFLLKCGGLLRRSNSFGGPAM